MKYKITITAIEEITEEEKSEIFPGATDEEIDKLYQVSWEEHFFHHNLGLKEKTVHVERV
ncbi:hypothetical protein ACFL7M_17695 [Thermodesulfobacteriota bacterium]